MYFAAQFIRQGEQYRGIEIHNSSVVMPSAKHSCSLSSTSSTKFIRQGEQYQGIEIQVL